MGPAFAVHHDPVVHGVVLVATQPADVALAGDPRLLGVQPGLPSAGGLLGVVLLKFEVGSTSGPPFLQCEGERETKNN